MPEFRWYMKEEAISELEKLKAKAGEVLEQAEKIAATWKEIIRIYDEVIQLMQMDAYGHALVRLDNIEGRLNRLIFLMAQYETLEESHDSDFFAATRRFYEMM